MKKKHRKTRIATAERENGGVERKQRRQRGEEGRGFGREERKDEEKYVEIQRTHAKRQNKNNRRERDLMKTKEESAVVSCVYVYIYMCVLLVCLLRGGGERGEDKQRNGTTDNTEDLKMKKKKRQTRAH